VSRLFTAIAFAELVYARNHITGTLDAKETQLQCKAAFGTRNTAENLQASIDGENFETKGMYPAYKKVAESQGEKAAETSFTWALEAEKIHTSFYQKTKQAVDLGEDVNLGPTQICTVCGYTVEDETPERCPSVVH